MEKIILQVQESCTADWGQMIPQEQGRFCGQCEKIVFDFSAMDDQEIIAQIERSSKGICGRFYEDQLRRELERSISFAKQPIWKNKWGGMAAGLILLGSLSFHAAEAKQMNKVEEIWIKSNQQETVQPAKKLGRKSHIVEKTVQDSSKVLITGKVVCKDNGQSLIGADISIGQYHTKANEEGVFKLLIPQLLLNQRPELRAETIGYKTTIIRLDKRNNKLHKLIKMETRPIIMGMVAVSNR